MRVRCIRAGSTKILGGEPGDVGAAHFDADLVGDFQVDDLVVNLDDGADNAAAGDDLITLFQVVQERLMFFGLLLLGPDQEKIKDHDHEDHGDHKTHH